MNIVKGLPPQAYPDEHVALDTEIYGIPAGQLHRPVGTFACLSICMGRELDRPADHEPTVYQIYDPLDLPAVLERLRGAKLIFQNALFDIRQIRRWANLPQQKIWDTLVVDQGLWGGYHSSFGLDALSLRYLGEYLPKETRDSFLTASEMTPEMEFYAALDPYVTLRIAEAQIEKIAETDRSLDHYWLADEPTIWAILDMKPAHVDVDGWHQLAETFRNKTVEIQSHWPDVPFGAAGTNRHVRGWMEDHAHYRATDSLDEEHLRELYDRFSAKGNQLVCNFITDLLTFRGAAKMENTYGDNWLQEHLTPDGVIPAWKTVGAATGRMACGEPNLQNIPSREYPIFRTLFLASPGHRYLIADVAQQEPRILAVLSGDRYLTDALRAGVSPHILAGQRIFGDPDFSKKDPRYASAKQLNLGLSYGLTANGLSARAGIDVYEAEELISGYFKAFPGIKAYIDDYRRVAYKQGYVETLLGRRYYINPYSRRWENNAINSPIQGTGGDQMKIAIGYLHRECKTRGLPFSLCMVVHDEMVNDVPTECLPEYRALVDEAWQEAGQLTLKGTVPMVLDFHEGDNWGAKGE